MLAVVYALVAVVFAVLAVVIAVEALVFAVFAVVYALVAVVLAELAVVIAVLAVDCAVSTSSANPSAVSRAVVAFVSALSATPSTAMIRTPYLAKSSFISSISSYIKSPFPTTPITVG